MHFMYSHLFHRRLLMLLILYSDITFAGTGNPAPSRRSMLASLWPSVDVPFWFESTHSRLFVFHLIRNARSVCNNRLETMPWLQQNVMNCWNPSKSSPTPSRYAKYTCRTSNSMVSSLKNSTWSCSTFSGLEVTRCSSSILVPNPSMAIVAESLLLDCLPPLDHKPSAWRKRQLENWWLAGDAGLNLFLIKFLHFRTVSHRSTRLHLLHKSISLIVLNKVAWACRIFSRQQSFFM